MEQLHLLAQAAVVALLGLFQHGQIGLEILFVEPGGAIDALKHLVAGIAAPIGAGYLHQLEGLTQLGGGRQMRTAAQIDEITLAIKTDGLALGDRGDDLGLVLLADAFKESHGGVALHLLADDGFVAGDDLAHFGFDGFQIVRGERRRTGEVVIEAVLDGWADGDLGIGIQFLDGFGHHVGGVVTQQLQRVGILVRHDRHLGVGADSGAQILHHAVDANGQRRFGETGTDGLGNLQTRDRAVEIAQAAVRQSNGDHGLALVLKRFRNCWTLSFPAAKSMLRCPADGGNA